MVEKDVDNLKVKKFEKIAKKFAGYYGIISVDPVVIHVGRFLDQVPEFFVSYKSLFECLKSSEFHLINSWRGFAESDSLMLRIKASDELIRDNFPNVTSYNLCNTHKQLELFKANNLESIFCNHNCFIDERIFHPIDSITKEFDAVYDARIIELKRHYLGSKIKSIALLYARNDEERQTDYFAKILSDIPQAYLYNHNESGDYKNLSPEDVNRCLNECKVGLCLSEKEGAMLASAQYLLCGLPVVSTENLGGRDEFFDEEYVVTVRADPDEVKHAVQYLIGKNISRESIRKQTISRMKEHRERFIDLVQNIYYNAGYDRSFKDEWDSVFFNKLLKYQSFSGIIQRI